MSDSTLVTAETPSPFFAPQDDRTIRWVVIHDEEAKESRATAQAVANLFANPASPHAAAHYTVDVASIVQCVAEKDVAWAAGHTGNAYGIHLELSGYASQSTAEWLADASLLDLAASLAADICSRRGLPAVFVDAAGLRSQTPGITTHRELTAAFGETDHTDPGPNFPMDSFLQRVASQLAPPAPDLPSS
jgi:N-acetyl-anhydromuramyl-L-alanine amidase AmpD